MKLIIEIDDRDFSDVKEHLKMSVSQWRAAAVGKSVDWSKEEWLAARILMARKALGLGVSIQECCYDYIYYPEQSY